MHITRRIRPASTIRRRSIRSRHLPSISRSAGEASLSGRLIFVNEPEPPRGDGAGRRPPPGQDGRKGQPLFALDLRPLEAVLRQAEAVSAKDTAQARDAALA